MKWYAGITIVSFFFCSCTKTDGVPEGIIKPKEFQQIIWDMAKADSYSDVLRQKDTVNTFAKITMSLTDKMLSLHNTNRTQVENSFKFYSEHPDVFKVILDSLYNQQSRQNIPEVAKPVKPGKFILPK